MFLTIRKNQIYAPKKWDLGQLQKKYSTQLLILVYSLRGVENPGFCSIKTRWSKKRM